VLIGSMQGIDWVVSRSVLDFVAQSTVALLLLALCDLVAPRRARWFFLHTVANAGITLLSTPDLWRFLSSPLSGYTQEWTTTQPFALGNALHIYHVLFFPLSTLDWLHHGYVSVNISGEPH
jgi:hypothetical protein